MEKQAHCNCKSGCQGRRCKCVKNNEPCGEQCGCKGCCNPFNGVDLNGLTICALGNILRYKSLTNEELEKKYLLPCECDEVALKHLVKNYECKGCNETYWFSFCWGSVVQDSCSWHCEACGACRDWREWHCETCNKCTYGTMSPCEHCENSEGAFFLDEW